MKKTLGTMVAARSSKAPVQLMDEVFFFMFSVRMIDRNK